MDEFKRIMNEEVIPRIIENQKRQVKLIAISRTKFIF